MKAPESSEANATSKSGTKTKKEYGFDGVCCRMRRCGAKGVKKLGRYFVQRIAQSDSFTRLHLPRNEKFGRNKT